MKEGVKISWNFTLNIWNHCTFMNWFSRISLIYLRPCQPCQLVKEMEYPAFKIKSTFRGKCCFFLGCLCNKCNKCATLSLYCTFGVWRVVKGTCFTTYEEDISIKWELPLEHHQVLLSSLACTRRAEPKRWLPLPLQHTFIQTHLHILFNEAGCYTVCMHTHTYTSAAQWGTSIQLAWLLIKVCTQRRAGTGEGSPKGVSAVRALNSV